MKEEDKTIEEQFSVTLPPKKRAYKKKNPNGWGGARAGAGRPKTKDVQKETLCIRIDPHAREVFYALKERGANPTHLIEEHIFRIGKLFGVE